MPQFDIFSFFTLIFWLSIAYTFFFLITLKYLLKDSSMSLKIREKIKFFMLSFSKPIEHTSFYCIGSSLFSK